nr:hypothetical protein [Streptomyces inhibens]
MKSLPWILMVLASLIPLVLASLLHRCASWALSFAYGYPGPFTGPCSTVVIVMAEVEVESESEGSRRASVSR